MKWSWQVGTFFGITVHVHATVLLLLAALLVLPMTTGGTLASAFNEVAFVALAFSCVVLHEFGHALTARHFGVKTRDITLYPIGGIARLERIPRDPHQEFWIALAGPAVNVVIAVVLLAAFGTRAPLTWDLEGHVHTSLPIRLMWVNATLAAFNLLPAFPMDGGRVLRAYLAERMNYLRATQLAAHVGQGMALLFGFVGLVYNPMLLFVAFFVFVGAGEEANSVQAELLLEGVPVRDAMMTQYTVLAPEDPLARVVQLLLAGTQHDFPVLQGTEVVGLLDRSALLAALAERGPETTVSEVMTPAAAGVSPAESLRAAYQRMDDEGRGTLSVLDAGRLVGLLTLENLMEYLMVRNALTAGEKPPRRGGWPHLPHPVGHGSS
jgi:Zn-dependent protease/predicted transcriptional regulator